MRYFTSDTHFGHENIIRYCDRPFAAADEMNAALLHRARAHLGLGDTLWHLGDVALGTIKETLPNLAQIPVDVTLVAGNHDRCHPCNGARSERFADIYRDLCDLHELVRTNTTLRLANGMAVHVSHFPYADAELVGREDRHGDVIPDRFAQWRPPDDGSWLLCGHVHGSWRQRGRMINVGVDAWGGDPVAETTILELIDAGPQELAPLSWA